MKKIVLFFLMMFGLVCEIAAQSNQVSTRSYEYIADVKVYASPKGNCNYSIKSLGLYKLYKCNSYYIDQYGVKQYKWEEDGYYLKDTNDCYYKVKCGYGIADTPYGSSYPYPHKCDGFDKTYYFRYDF